MPENYSKLCLQGLSPRETRAAREVLATASAFLKLHFTDIIRGSAPSAPAIMPAVPAQTSARRGTGRLLRLPSRPQMNALDCHAAASGHFLRQLNIKNKWGQNRA